MCFVLRCRGERKLCGCRFVRPGLYVKQVFTAKYIFGRIRPEEFANLLNEADKCKAQAVPSLTCQGFLAASIAWNPVLNFGAGILNLARSQVGSSPWGPSGSASRHTDCTLLHAAKRYLRLHAVACG